MRRKIIELGNNCMVLSLPIKWVEAQHLKKGDELDVQIDSAMLHIGSPPDKKLPQEITCELSDACETLTRTLLVNYYRIGYDRLNLVYRGKKKDLAGIVDKQLLGFELFQKTTESYLLESVSEPSYEQFDNIVQKVFFIILEIIDNFHKEDIYDDVIKIQKYDNFLKRCISKTVFDPKSKLFLWQFLSQLTHISREFYHFCNELPKQVRFTELELAIILHMRQMILLIQKAYLTKNLLLLNDIHLLDKTFMSDKKKMFTKIKDPLRAYYFVHISRQLFLLNSPLIGILQTEAK